MIVIPNHISENQWDLLGGKGKRTGSEYINHPPSTILMQHNMHENIEGEEHTNGLTSSSLAVWKHDTSNKGE